MSKLPNAPLQEVIFELRWTLTPSEESGQVIDSEFELASGRLSSIIEKKFPHHQRITPSNIPQQLLQYQVVHQYWTDKNTWPVLQLGPGIFTINCTDNWYDWENSFRDLIKEAIEWLFQAYRNSLNIGLVSLRYIDAIKISDYGGLSDGWQNFIKSKFNFEYHNSFDTRGKQKQIQINQIFELNDGSDLHVQMTDGTTSNEEAFIWQIAILKKFSFTPTEILDWADNAHSIAHNLFKEMLKPEMYASFSRNE